MVVELNYSDFVFELFLDLAASFPQITVENEDEILDQFDLSLFFKLLITLVLTSIVSRVEFRNNSFILINVSQEFSS